ncbi:hypothetical protein [Methylophaga sp.]|uniref:hypothetical protein n=1 Tax=Methylophaga sp. TaxID=2024840 RepID=UPI003A9230CF
MNEEYWNSKETLTVEEAAMLACGFNPCEKRLSDQSEKFISSIQKQLGKHILNEKQRLEVFLKLKGFYGRELLQNPSLPDTLEWRKFESEIIFFNSFFHNYSALLRDEVYPTSDIDGYELLITDVKAWLKLNQIKSKFFSEGVLLPSVQILHNKSEQASPPADKNKGYSDLELDRLIDAYFPSRPHNRQSKKYLETKEYMKEYYQKYNSIPNFEDYWAFLKTHTDNRYSHGSITTYENSYTKTNLRKNYSNWRKKKSI